MEVSNEKYYSLANVCLNQDFNFCILGAIFDELMNVVFVSNSQLV